MINAIHNFTCIELNGNPVPPMQRRKIVQRAGVDGTGIWRMGSRGDKFTLRAGVDVPNMAAGRLAFALATAFTNADPVILIQDGYDFNLNQSWKVSVLGVRQVALFAVLNATGGLFPPSLAWLEIDFDLIAIANQ